MPGIIPRGLSSLYYFRPNRSEVRAWWDTYGKRGLPDEKAAIRLVQDASPDLRAYPSDTFPIKAIITQRAPDGWYVAFVVEGSGYRSSRPGAIPWAMTVQVRLTGNISHRIMVMPQDFSAEKCG